VVIEGDEMGFRIGHLEWPTNGNADAVLSVVMLRHGIQRVSVTTADMQAAPQLSITTGGDDITFAIDDEDFPEQADTPRAAAVQVAPSRAVMAAVTVVVCLVIAALFAPLVVLLWRAVL
jgi:hypothetical protein